MNLLNRFWEGLSPRLRRAFLVVVVVIGATFAATVAILVWSDGSLHQRLGLVVTNKDLSAQTAQLMAVDSAKMAAMATRAASEVRDELVGLMDSKETDARQTVLAPLLEEVKQQRKDINTLFGLVQAQGKEVRALPTHFSRELETILEASKPPKSDADLIKEMLEAQTARQDSILKLLAEPGGRKKLKAPPM